MNEAQELLEVLNVKSTVQKMIKEQGGIDGFLRQILLPVINEMNERKFPTKLITGFQADMAKMAKPIREFEEQ